MLFIAGLGPLKAAAQSGSESDSKNGRFTSIALDTNENWVTLDRQARSEIGLPFSLTHFAAQDYEQHYQNWEVVQDEDGIIYVANHDGVLEYDGQSWRLIPTFTHTTARSLALTDTTVYVGAQGDFGYLQADSTGVNRYVSLIDKVPANARNFEDVWGTHATPEGIYFQTKEHLFRWDGHEITVWNKTSKKGFHTSFEVRKKLYVRDFRRGLLEIDNDSLQQAPDGKRLAETSVYAMMPYGEGKTLIGTSKDGILLYDGRKLVPFPTEADAFLKENQIYNGKALPGGRFALATLGGGLVVIDSEGQIVQMLSRETGLPGNYVTSVYPGRQGGLWMTFGNSGVARADLRPQLSRFDDRLGLEGIIYQIKRYRGELYAATGTGVYRLQRNTLAPLQHERASFKRLSGLLRAWDFCVTSRGLFAAGERGIYVVREDSVQLISNTAAYSLAKSDRFENRIYAGVRNGLAQIKEQNGEWRVQTVKDMGHEVRALVESDNGDIWMSSDEGKALRLRFHKSEGSLTSKITRYDTSDGLPDGEMAIAILGGKPAFYTAKSGLYRAQRGPNGKMSFAPDTVLQPPNERDSLSALLALAGGKNSIWLAYRDYVEIAVRQSSGSYRHVTPPSLRFSRGATRMYIEPDRVAWISDGNELVRYQPYGEPHRSVDFPVLIRQVKAVGTDNVVYGGNARARAGQSPSNDTSSMNWSALSQQAGYPRAEQAATRLPYAQNSLKFAFIAPDYRETVRNEYQYRLKGENRSWSDWTTRPHKTYASLGPGRYRFQVRARNGHASLSTASYAFRILPPWYRTWAAYGAYLAALVLLGAGYWRYRKVLETSRRAEQRARELKRERGLSQRLQEANERLEEANQLKDELLANTSHELRTPLTSIQGFTEILKEEVPEEHHEFLGHIETNTQRLIQTVNALLSLAKLRAGMTEIDRRPVDLGKQADEVVALLRPLATKKNLTLQLDKEDGTKIYADPQYLHQILNNLINNAIKFTKEGGVTVTVKRRGDEARLEVCDTGIGISSDFLPHLFEDFKQESRGLTRTHEGSGLGMGITARLVEMMNGEISVESEQGTGSLFTVTFPLAEEQEGAAPKV